MAFSLQQFVRVRPYLYHLTSSSNLDRIRRIRRLESATSLLGQAGQPTQIQQRRASHQVIVLDGAAVSLRDQSPLYAGNIDFEAGWTFASVIAMLNERVFFWPGRIAGPIDYGLRHYARYEAERPTVIRIPTHSLFQANLTNAPMFCRYNSGSPRCSNGARSPRGAATFQLAEVNGYKPGNVVEVTFVGSACLPDDAELRGRDWTQWTPL